jgi:hypothetical protein
MAFCVINILMLPEGRHRLTKCRLIPPEGLKDEAIEVYTFAIVWLPDIAFCKFIFDEQNMYRTFVYGQYILI